MSERAFCPQLRGSLADWSIGRSTVPLQRFLSPIDWLDAFGHSRRRERGRGKEGREGGREGGGERQATSAARDIQTVTTTRHDETTSGSARQTDRRAVDRSTLLHLTSARRVCCIQTQTKPLARSLVRSLLLLPPPSSLSPPRLAWAAAVAAVEAVVAAVVAAAAAVAATASAAAATESPAAVMELDTVSDTALAITASDTTATESATAADFSTDPDFTAAAVAVADIVRRRRMKWCRPEWPD